jgi:hypothetical protein
MDISFVPGSDKLEIYLKDIDSSNWRDCIQLEALLLIFWMKTEI